MKFAALIGAHLVEQFLRTPQICSSSNPAIGNLNLLQIGFQWRKYRKRGREWLIFKNKKIFWWVRLDGWVHIGRYRSQNKFCKKNRHLWLFCLKIFSLVSQRSKILYKHFLVEVLGSISSPTRSLDDQFS